MNDSKSNSTNQDAIVHSSAYRRAYEDVEFLSGPRLRHVRMEIEFLKPDLTLEDRQISHTIVVYGSTRIVEPSLARERLAAAKGRLADRPEDPALLRGVAQAERIAAKSVYYDMAREFARMVSSSHLVDGQPKFTVATGGGPGIMEAANRGADDVSAPSIGLNISLPLEQQPNPYITPGLCFQFQYFAIRKFHFVMRAMGLVAFPGGFGTLDEVFEVLTLRQTNRMQHIPIILVGVEFWEKVVNFQYLADEGTIADDDLKLFSVVDSAQDAWRIIREFHRL